MFSPATTSNDSPNMYMIKMTQSELESAFFRSMCNVHHQVDKAAIAELEDGLYVVNFVPCEMGIHTVSVSQGCHKFIPTAAVVVAGNP